MLRGGAVQGPAKNPKSDPDLRMAVCTFYKMHSPTLFCHSYTHSAHVKTEAQPFETSGLGRPCAHPAGCEKFSWVLFIVSIIPGNEDSAIRTQLAVVLGCVRQNRIPGLQEGRTVCQEGCKEPLGTSDAM